MAVYKGGVKGHKPAAKNNKGGANLLNFGVRDTYFLWISSRLCDARDGVPSVSTKAQRDWGFTPCE